MPDILLDQFSRKKSQVDFQEYLRFPCKYIHAITWINYFFVDYINFFVQFQNLLESLVMLLHLNQF